DEAAPAARIVGDEEHALETDGLVPREGGGAHADLLERGARAGPSTTAPSPNDAVPRSSARHDAKRGRGAAPPSSSGGEAWCRRGSYGRSSCRLSAVVAPIAQIRPPPRAAASTTAAPPWSPVICGTA